MAWYNIYRPSKFEDVSGQTIVKSVLQNALAHNKVKHGYLLSGPKGTGKTTLARIFANSLNDIEHNPQASIDIVELDAASNSGVDNIRNLIESAKTAPFAGTYKVYIIDEVHMLSKSAMNALLKILEEPPEYLVFLLATTNPEKLLPTVLSRLTKLTLTSHTLQDIVDRLEFIAGSEKMQIDQLSLQLIAKRANGGQRDAINILETLYSYGLEKYTIADTTNLLGLLPAELLQQIGQVFVTQDFASIKAMVSNVEKVGLDGESFMGQLLGYLLEQSFEANDNLDSLIIPVAEILDLKLPINTVAASFALIQAKLREKGLTINSPKFVQTEQKKNPSVDKVVNSSGHLELDSESKNPQQYKTQIPLVSKKNGQSDSNDLPLDRELHSISILPDTILNQVHDDNFLLDTIDAPLMIKEDLKNDLSVSNFSTQQIQFIIHSFTKSPLCVMMFKILIPQIVVENIEENMITISLTAPTFISQLENSKNQKLILDHVFEQTKVLYKLKLITRSTVNDPLKDHRTQKEIQDSKLQAEDKNNRYEAPKPSYGKKYEGPTRQVTQTQPKNDDSEILEKYGKKSSDLKTNSKSSKPSTKPSQKYFYSVYRGLPANTVGDELEKSQVPVRLEPLPFPTKAEINIEQNTNWSTEIEEIFDF
jgi:DNA polymerase III subunit gamma/tau